MDRYVVIYEEDAKRHRKNVAGSRLAGSIRIMRAVGRTIIAVIREEDVQ